MEKIINPVMCEVNGKRARGFAKIQFKDGRLSISGVIGPLRSGNCKGSCGQCVNEFREGEPTDGWTKEMVQKFCDIWDEWHLNDVRPYCQHQKELGWGALAGKKVTLYNYKLRREALDKKIAAKRAAIKALEKGDTFTPDEEQSKYASLPYSITTSTPISGDDAKNYEPKKSLFAGMMVRHQFSVLDGSERTNTRMGSCASHVRCADTNTGPVGLKRKSLRR